MSRANWFTLLDAVLIVAVSWLVWRLTRKKVAEEKLSAEETLELSPLELYRQGVSRLFFAWDSRLRPTELNDKLRRCAELNLDATVEVIGIHEAWTDAAIAYRVSCVAQRFPWAHWRFNCQRASALARELQQRCPAVKVLL